MSWNTSILLQRTRSGLGKASYFANLGLPGAKEVGTTTFESASSSGLMGKALAVIEDWTIVVDPLMFMEVANDSSFESPGLLPNIVESRLISSSDQSPAYLLLAMGASSTYGFASYEGKSRTRLFLTQEEFAVYDEGDPLYLSSSAALCGDQEEMVLALIEKVTGITWDSLENAEFTIFEFDQDHLKFVHED